MFIKIYKVLFCIFFLVMGSAVSAKDISYDFTVTGLDSKEYSVAKAAFKSHSSLKNKDSKSDLTVSNLQKRLKTDVALMTDILRAEGYYDSQISQRFIQHPKNVEINIHVSSGPVYTVGDIIIKYGSPLPSEPLRNQMFDRLGLIQGAAARAVDIMSAEARLTILLPDLGFPFAEDMTQDIVIDHQSRKMNVNFALNTGMRQHLSSVEIKGLETIDQSTVEQFILWETGDYFDQRLLRELRERLNKTSLFASINIDVIPKTTDQAGIQITVKEAKHRTVGVAVGYSTSEGVGGEISWQTRNFMHKGSRLKLVGRATELEQSFTSRLEVPNFSRLDQTLSFGLEYVRQNTDAFLSHSVTTDIGLTRIISDNLVALAGFGLEYSHITEATSDRHFYIASLPVGVRWDSSDDLLDPHRGARVSFFMIPNIGLKGEKLFFLKSEFQASSYFPLFADHTILALRTRVGAIVGTETENLPATSRFYAGGGSSIRGYSFQGIGPMDGDENPVGGRSVAEVSAEIRWKFMENISLVPFIEGGNIFDSNFPKFNNFRWGAGIGLRYHTAFGPLRFDVAFPVNRRETDSKFQIYISLGQAF